MHSRSLVERAVADDPDVARREAELVRRGVGGLVGKEARHQHRALALGEPFEAGGELALFQGARLGRLDRLFHVAPGLEQPLAPRRSATQLEHRHPAHAEDERGEPLGVAQAAGAQPLEGRHEHLLHQVLGGVPVAQVAQPVEPHPRREAAAELGLGLRVGGGSAPGDGPGERGVVHRLSIIPKLLCEEV